LVFVLGFCSTACAQIITTVAGSGARGYAGDGSPAVSAKFDAPTSLATDGSGNVYINDQLNNCVRKVAPSGIVTTIAGKGPDSTGYTGDGGPATSAKLSSNWGIATDAGGNIYITDQNNNCIRKVNTSGIISTIAGTGTAGFWGDGGAATAALLHTPIGIAVDGAGNIYVGDADNWRIRMINTSGVISTIAGNGAPGYSGDGGSALMANVGNTFGLATDAYGNIYFCDVDPPYNRIRKISASGTITTVAGTNSAGYSGDGMMAVTAELDEPTGVFVDNSGDIYIADYNNNRIRNVNASGIINTIAGTGTTGFSGDGNLAINAKLNNPLYVTMDHANAILYLTDFSNVRIRMVSNANVVNFTNGKSQNLTVCENSTNNPLNAQLTILDHEVGFTDTWGLLSGPFHGSADVSYSATATGGTVSPTDLYYAPAVGYVGNDTLSVTVNDGIAADTTTIYITVDPVIPYTGAISGASNVCVGSSITLSETVTGGVWSISNSSATLTGSALTGAFSGTEVVTYTVTNPCGTASISKTISVNPVPDPGMITGASEMCIGSTVSLTDTVAGGIWNVANTNVAVTATSTGSIVTGQLKGFDTVSYTVTNTLCEATTIFALIIDSFPDAGMITGLPGVCIGAQIKLTDTTSGGIWGTTNANVTLAGSTITGVSPGRDSIIYSVINTCGTDSMIQIEIVEPLPDTPTITQVESILSVPTGYASYEWLLNGVKIPGAIADTYAAVSGIYDVMVTNSFGCSVSSQPVTVYGCDPNDILIYPNPATSMVYIDWCKRVTARLMCLDGKTLSLTKNINKIELGNIADGTYMLSLFDGNGIRIKTKRITKLSK